MTAVRRGSRRSAPIMTRPSPLDDYDRAGRILLQALGTGSHGFLAAYRMVQLFPGPFPWHNVLNNLCTQVPSQDALKGKLILKPKLFLLPIQLQRNLFCLLNVVFHRLPTPYSQLVAEAVRMERDITDDWLLKLTQKFLQNFDHDGKARVQRAQVIERLQILCKTGAEPSKLGQLWSSSPIDSLVHGESQSPLEDERESSLNEELCVPSQSHDCVEELKMEEVATPKEELTLLIKGYLSNLKQTVDQEDTDSETSDQDCVLKLKTICDTCKPLQLQTAFSCLGVSEISPKCLFRLCTHLDSISPEVSYAHAESLAGILFLEAVLSLSAPASRTLTAALTVFCRKYAGPACNALVIPLLAEAEAGSVHADFLCRMISECLESQEQHLCFEPVFKVPCSEVSVSILYMLVDKQETLHPSQLDRLIDHLNKSAEDFSKSMAFSKLLLVLLTRKRHLLQSSHIGFLTKSSKTNQTFLKAALQNALMKLQECLK